MEQNRYIGYWNGVVMSMVSSNVAVIQTSAGGVQEKAKNDRKKQRRRRNNSKKKNAVEHERQKIMDLEDSLKLAKTQLKQTEEDLEFEKEISAKFALQHHDGTILLRALMKQIQMSFAVFGFKEDEMQRVVKEMGYPPDRIRKETNDRYDFLRKIDCSEWKLDDFIKTANEMGLYHNSCLNPKRSVILDWAEILYKTVYSNYPCAVQSASELLNSRSQDVQDKSDSKRIDELETKINELNEENHQLKADLADYKHNLFAVPEKKFRVF